MAMPCSTPTRATPRNAATESRHSTRRWRQSRTRPGMSASDSDAAMTMAASVGCGRLRSSPGTNTSMSTIAAAPTTPVSCVLAPACSATAVREPLVLTGKPWKNPAATLAAPMPIISPLPSTSWPVRAANADAVEMVSASATRAMPTAPATSSGRSDAGLGHREGREALAAACRRATRRGRRGRGPPEAAIAITTATSTPGTRGSTREQTRISARLTRPTATAAADRLAVGQALDEAARLVDQAVAARPRSRTAWAAGRSGWSAPAR